MVYLKLILRVSLAAAIALLQLSPAYAAGSLKKGSELRITLAEAAMKSSPKPFGSSVLRTLPKGTAVTYLGASGIYYQISDGQRTGYIVSKSVVAAAKFKSFSRTGRVSQSDMAAATKGFSPEVEQENRKNKQLRYDLMDRAEQLSSVHNPESKLQRFRQQGRLGEYINE